ncbi:MAG: DNA repair protein RecN [Clostridia bacterium]|nr:DNA repair protein RecN [Clostridia bacterium]
MLQSLTIKNIALIDNVTIELGRGFNVLTGETGAGKSLIIDSLALLLGEKADKTLISYGESQASVEAVFETNSQLVLDRLVEFGLERENTIVISRKLTSDGKNECRVNGKTFTLSMLKAISAPLMDLHGQFQHQEILKESNQLKIIDEFGGSEVLNAKQNYFETFKKLKAVKKELSSFNFDSRDREKLLDLYSYQIKEIEDANFVDGEEEELKEFRMKVLNQEKIAFSLGRISSCLDGNGEVGAVELIKKCDNEFGEVLKFLPNSQELADRISSARYELEDILDSIESLKDELTFDEYSAAENEKRLDLLSSLKKKYGANIAEINAYLENIKREYEKLNNSAEMVEKLEKQRGLLLIELKEKAAILSNIRRKFAKNFEEKVKFELSELSMKGANLLVDFETVDETLADETGFDKITFMFSANAGQPVKPLSKVASGGEMSRFMLAVKNITADIDQVDTMIFDEIDTGISGDTANVLAEKLAKIGKKHQVICVTHLAQVASFGTTHFYISKFLDNGKTRTSVELLDESKKVQEIARIIGGAVSSFSIEHAKLMIDAGKNFNKN